eukprot:Hpha_TRINITY_DN15517_c2_g1::TRINITY_DN15517_c2_g1_i2::g.107135::m.107135
MAVLAALSRALVAAKFHADVDVEEYNENLFSSITFISVFAVLGVVIGVLACSIAYSLIRHRKARLALLLLGMQVFAVVAAGVGTWAITYLAARRSIREQTTDLIVSVGEAAELEVTRSLQMASQGAAALATQMMTLKSLLNHTGNPYPVVHTLMRDVDATALPLAVEWIVVGWEDGGSEALLGLWRTKGKDAPDAFLVETSTPASNRERRCQESGMCNLVPACRAPGGGCEFCKSADGSVPSMHEVCDSWRPAFIGDFFVPYNATGWDIPPTSNVDTAVCHPSAQRKPGAVDSVKLGGGQGRWWYRPPAGDNYQCNWLYDPRLRPWYTLKPEPQWAQVYVYSEEAGGVLGTTVSVGIPNLDYDGTPWTGGTPANPNASPWLGSVGVDLTMQSLSAALKRSQPTASSVLFLIQVCSKGSEEIVMASSLPAEEIILDIGGRRRPRMAGDETWEWTPLFGVIQKRFGTLSAAANASKTVLQYGSHGTILASPVRVGTGLWLSVIYIPYEDTLGDTENASVFALLLACIVSLCSGLLLFCFATATLRPFHIIEDQMEKVALLQLEDLPPPPRSVVTEIERMSDHFSRMVENLTFYRDFVPQSVFSGNEFDIKSDSTATSDGTLNPNRNRISHDPEASTGTNLSVQREGTGSSASSSEQKRDVVRAWELDTGLVSKRVTVLHSNVSNWLDTYRALKDQAFCHLHNAYVANCSEQAKRFKGTADFARGDRVCLSFNATQSVRNSSQHAEHALLAAKVISGWRGLPGTPLSVSCGVATGRAQIGILGAVGLRSVAILGSPSISVMVCERLASMWGIGTVADSGCRQDSEMSCTARILCAVQYRKLKRVGPMLLWEIVDVTTQSSGYEEWMYQLADKQDTHGTFNIAAEALIRGDKQSALEALERSPGQASCSTLFELACQNSPVNLVIEFTDVGGVPPSAPFLPRGSSPQQSPRESARARAWDNARALQQYHTQSPHANETANPKPNPTDDEEGDPGVWAAFRQEMAEQLGRGGRGSGRKDRGKNPITGRARSGSASSAPEFRSRSGSDRSRSGSDRSHSGSGRSGSDRSGSEKSAPEHRGSGQTPVHILP